MPKITTYNRDNTINENDKIIGTDSQTGQTKNYKLRDIANFVNAVDSTYTHNQNNASTTWTINHNLDKFPSVSIKFSSSDEVYTNVGAFAGVTYTDENNLTINLAVAESGYAYLN